MFVLSAADPVGEPRDAPCRFHITAHVEHERHRKPHQRGCVAEAAPCESSLADELMAAASGRFSIPWNRPSPTIMFGTIPDIAARREARSTRPSPASVLRPSSKSPGAARSTTRTSTCPADDDGPSAA